MEAKYREALRRLDNAEKEKKTMQHDQVNPTPSDPVVASETTESFPPEMVRFIEFAQKSAERWMAFQEAAAAPRITVEATSDELATIFRARADVAEAKAVEVEREAAEPEPEDEAQAEVAEDQLRDAGVRAVRAKIRRETGKAYAETLRAYAKKERWVADHLIPGRKHVLGLKEIEQLFHSTSCCGSLLAM